MDLAIGKMCYILTLGIQLLQSQVFLDLIVSLIIMLHS